MANKPGLLARMIGRATRHPVVTTLYTHAIGQPLLVHPQLGEALLGAYLSGAVDAPAPLVEAAVAAPATGDNTQAAGGEVRVLNISGALVNRPAPGLCDPGPVSYEAIGDALDEAMADSNVKAVVLRLASPGGMAAGCFDLADRIYAARGTKPIYAMVDDYAYSAAYAAAAACDEIWVTRTAGVGSVGVVCWHVDQTEYDKKLGIKVTPIFAGARKVDYSPHLPLSKEAFDAEQAEVDRLAEMFITSVATYRGMDPAVVRDTQAACFNGPLAVAAGFADRVGTFRDLLAHINAPAVEEEDPAAANDDATGGTVPTGYSVWDADTPSIELSGAQSDEQAFEARRAATTHTTGKYVEALLEVGTEVEASQPAALSPEVLAKLDKADKAAEIADACPDRISPALAQALLAIDFPAAEVPGRIEHALKVADLCAAAKIPEAAVGYVKRNTDLEQVRAELAAAVAVDPLPTITTALPTGPKESHRTTLNEEIYSRRREAAAGTGK